MARWQSLPIAGGSYADESRPFSTQDTVNYLVEKAERNGTRSSAKLRGVPGLSTFCITGSNAPVRGARDVEGRLLVVSGNTLYKVSALGAATAIGTIPGIGRVSMSHNQITGGNEVAIANGQLGYIYNTVNETLTQITDDGFPGSISFEYLDSYIMGVEPGRRFGFHSNLAAAGDYNTLDRYEAEGSPDRLVGQIVTHREWWLCGERTIEPFADTGAATGTFQRQSGLVIERGVASAHCLSLLDNSVFWVGDDGIVYRANGYTPQRISTMPIEQALAQCDLSQCFSFTFEDEGHKVYYLTCPDGYTFGFDVASGEWHRRQSKGLKRWRINTLTKWNGVWIAGDYSNGKLYQLDWKIQEEAGEELERRRVMGAIHDNNNALIVNAFALTVDTGSASVTRTPNLLIAPLAIAGDLPDGTVGDAVSYAYTSSGGVLPHTFAIASGALPPGLAISSAGIISGTLTSSGSYSWYVRVTDADGATATVVDGALIASGVPAPGESGWKYLVTTLADTSDYSATAFDDSAWTVGAAPFGNGNASNPDYPPYASLNPDPRFKSTIATTIPLNQRCWMRSHFSLNSVPATATISLIVDNGMSVWINGVQVFSTNQYYGTYMVASIDTSSMVIGDNVISIRGDDQSNAGSNNFSYFDVLIDSG